jgi:Flp pilus assembly CpaE family ATPase
MSTNSNSHFDTKIPESLTANDLSIAVIGPDERLRSALVASLGHCHQGEVREFSSYPPGLDDLPHLLDQNHDIIMIELDSKPEYALDVMEGICAHGGSTVMVYSKKTDPEVTDPDLLMRCMRVGAREFLSLPFGETAIAEALVRAAARRPPARAMKKSDGRLYVFCGAKGGAGVTAIACTFATALARESGKSTLLIDLDLPLGDTAINLGLSPQYSTLDALQNASRLDASFLSRLLVKHASGLSVLAAPGAYSIYLPSSEAIGKLLTLARSEFENVVVDAGSKLDSAGTAAHFKEASTIYLVTQSGIPELRNANRLIAQYQGADGPKVEVVLNRFESRGSRITEDDLKKALTRPAAWKIPNDYNAVRRMQDTAAPVMATDSSISWQIDQMARSACGLPEVPQKKKGFSLRGLGRPAPPKEPDADGSASLLKLGLLGAADAGEIQESAGAEFDEPSVEASTEESCRAAKENDEPGTRVFNGRAYRLGEDGSWRQCANGEGPPAGEVPALEWPAPQAVAFGTPLGAEQFNATASVAGRFVYTPRMGYVLPAGQHTLWVTFVPKEAKAPAVESSVVLTVTKATPAIEWPRPAAVCYGTALGAQQLNATASVPGTFDFVPAAGEVPSVGIRSLLVRFTPEDKANYEEARAEVSLTVTKAPTSIHWTPPTAIAYGTALGAQLNATASVPGTLTYIPAEGTVLGAGRHTLRVEFTPDDVTNHTEACAEVSLIVAKATPTILWPAPHPVSYGTPLSRAELNATCPVAGSIVYLPGEGAVLGAGRHTPRAMFTPSDGANYNTAHATVPLVVTKAVPLLAWAAPEAIEYGTPLGEAELNATASVPGTFAYSPAAGSVLGEGQHTLSVTFTPIDGTNFTTAMTTAPLAVKAARPIEITWAEPEPIRFGTRLGAEQLNARAGIAGMFRYMPAEDELLPAGRHQLSATFVPADSNLPEGHASVELTVAKATPVVEWQTPRAVPYGTALNTTQLNATASVPGTMMYDPPQGEVLPAGVHRLTANFVPADDGNVEPGHAEVGLTVTKAVPVLNWVAPGAIEYGTALGAAQLNAESSVAGSFVYAPAAGTVLTAGTQTLSVSFVPADAQNYAAAQASVPILIHELAEMKSDEPQVAESPMLEPPVDTLAEAMDLVGRKSAEQESRLAEDEGPRMVCIDVGASRKTEACATANRMSDTALLTRRAAAAVMEMGDETEIRTYRGAMYRKGTDGQWHLVRN